MINYDVMRLIIDHVDDNDDIDKDHNDCDVILLYLTIYI